MQSSAEVDVLSVPYQDFVFRLCKPPEKLAGEMTPEKAHLWHMAPAALGETAELLAAVIIPPEDMRDAATRREDIVEELGDLQFYDTGLDLTGDLLVLDKHEQQTLEDQIAERGLNPHGSISATIPLAAGAIALTCDIVIAAGLLQDAVKQYAIYNKPIPRVAVAFARLVLRDAMRKLMMFIHITPDEVEKHNRLKLAERYKKLVYSDTDAALRADKA